MAKNICNFSSEQKQLSFSLEHMELSDFRAENSCQVSDVEEKYRNFSLLPLTHEHILKSILLYSDAATLRACEDVCHTWSSWISSSRIWADMLAVEMNRAVSLAWSVRCCNHGVGVEWMNHEGCDFVLHRLEHLAEAAKEIIKQSDYNQKIVKKKALKICQFIDDTWKIMMTEDFHELMIKLLKKEEKKGKQQVQILPRELRSSLIDWTFDIGGEYAFKTDTVHQAVSIVDTALCLGLQYNPQVLAITALRIAAELEDGDSPPSLYDLYTDATGDEFTQQQISDMEENLLKKLQYNWYLPSSHLFISMLGKMTRPQTLSGHVSRQVIIHLAHYYSDLLLVAGHPAGQVCSPSFTASACLASAHQYLGHETWSPSLASITGYTRDQLDTLINYTQKLHQTARYKEHQAVPNKYMDTEFYCVAMLDQNLPLRNKVILDYFNMDNDLQ